MAVIRGPCVVDVCSGGTLLHNMYHILFTLYGDGHLESDDEVHMQAG